MANPPHPVSRRGTAKGYGLSHISVTKSTAASEVQIPQSSIDEVYNFIISDLEAAIAALPDTYSTEAETRGRATKGAANSAAGTGFKSEFAAK